MSLTSAVFSGDTSLLVYCAESYLDAGHAVRAVVTDRPAQEVADFYLFRNDLQAQDRYRP